MATQSLVWSSITCLFTTHSMGLPFKGSHKLLCLSNWIPKWKQFRTTKIKRVLPTVTIIARYIQKPNQMFFVANISWRFVEIYSWIWTVEQHTQALWTTTPHGRHRGMNMTPAIYWVKNLNEYNLNQFTYGRETNVTAETTASLLAKVTLKF